MADPIRVALCDDHPIMRGGLRTLLEAETDVEVVGEARDVDEAVAVAQTFRPDVFIVDISLPGGSGIEATRKILEVSQDSHILVLTMHEEVEYLRAAFDSGALGYITKEAAQTDLVMALRIVAKGKRYVYPTLGPALLEEKVPEVAKFDGQLSDRELSVLRMIALGFTNSEIASEMYLSVRTIESYRARIQRKLGVKTRAAMVRVAREGGLLDQE